MPRFFGSADEEELARRRAVGDMRGTTGGMGPGVLNRGQYFAYGSDRAGQVLSPVVTNSQEGARFATASGVQSRPMLADAPAQPRYFGNIGGNRSMPNAPGRTQTMFSNVPGERSLTERRLMQGGGSVANRRALMDERKLYEAGEQAERMGGGLSERKFRQAQEDARLDRENALAIARIRGPETAGVRTQGALAVQTMKGEQVLEQLNEKQRLDLGTITERHELAKDEIRLRGDIDAQTRGELLAQAGKQKIEAIRETLGADVALAVAMKEIEAATSVTESAEKDETGDTTKVSKRTDTSFTRPEGLPGAGTEGVGQGDEDGNGIADEDEAAMVWAKENKKQFPIKAGEIEKRLREKYPNAFGTTRR
jgi:hypothetical protein